MLLDDHGKHTATKLNFKPVAQNSILTLVTSVRTFEMCDRHVGTKTVINDSFNNSKSVQYLIIYNILYLSVFQ